MAKICDVTSHLEIWVYGDENPSLDELHDIKAEIVRRVGGVRDSDVKIVTTAHYSCSSCGAAWPAIGECRVCVHGFDAYGRDHDGRDRDGFDRDGFDRDGRDIDGRDRNGRDRNGRNRDGHTAREYNGG